MNFFKSVDEKFAEIGLVKVEESDYVASYERKTKFGYTQCVDLVHKASGFHLIQSYEKGVNTDGFSNAVGMNMYEVRLCLKKMKQMGWKEKKGCVSV